MTTAHIPPIDIEAGGADLQFEAWAADRLDNLDAMQRMDVVRKLMWFADHDQRLAAVARDGGVLAVFGSKGKDATC